MNNIRKLTLSAPNRERVEENGLWHTRPWTREGVLEARQAGMWFTGQEEFESKEARALALRSD